MGRGHPPGLMDQERAKLMAAAYSDGMTLQEIGDAWAITRERVRQILVKVGMTREFGGNSMRALRRVEDRRVALAAKMSQRADRLWRRWSLSPEAYRAHVKEWGSTARRGSPLRGFIEQRRNAARRGIGWQITFVDWWRIWQESGHWQDRGRGQGYCMARWGDDGPYSEANVYICTIGQNFSDSYITKPWHQRWPNGHPAWGLNRQRRQLCKYGHPLSGDNLYVLGRLRVCRICDKRRRREWYVRKKKRAEVRV